MSAVTGFRAVSARRILAETGWRMALVLLAAATVCADAPVWLRAPLSIAAVVVVGEFFVRRHRRRGALGAVLVAVGGAVAALVLLGLLLNLLPTGLTSVSWGIAAGLFELVVLVAASAVGRPRPRNWSLPTRSTLIGGALAGVVLVGALVWSIASFTTTHVAPIAIGAQPSGGSLVVTVTSGASDGPFQLDLVTAAGRTTLATGILVGPGVTTAGVTVPASAQGDLELVRSADATIVRTLTLGAPAGTTAVAP